MRWLSAQYPSTCRCGERIERGFMALRVMNSRSLLCRTCGKRAMARAAETEERLRGAYRNDKGMIRVED